MSHTTGFRKKGSDPAGNFRGRRQRQDHASAAFEDRLRRRHQQHEEVLKRARKRKKKREEKQEAE